MDNLLFLGVPILKHIRLAFKKGENMSVKVLFEAQKRRKRVFSNTVFMSGPPLSNELTRRRPRNGSLAVHCIFICLISYSNVCALYFYFLYNVFLPCK